MPPVTMIRPKYSQNLTNADAVMSVIRIKMYDHDINNLAEYIGCTVGCLYAVRRGATVWPRPKTFFGLIECLDLELLVRRRGTNSN